MTEKEYRISILKKKVEEFRNKKIILYGTGRNTEAILSSCPELNVVGIADEKYEGGYFHGKKILSKNDIINLGADTIILGAQPDSAQSIYDRILEFCSVHKIAIYDMCGNSMCAYEQKMSEADTYYMNMSFNKAKNMLLKHECAGFDFEDVIAIADLSNEKYTFVPNGTQFSDNVLDEWKRHVIPRKQIIKLINCAIEKNIDVFVLAENGFPNYFITNLLNDWGIKGDVKAFTTRDLGQYKINGLFREAVESFSGKECIFYGTSIVPDGILASMYGVDYVMIKTAKQLFEMGLNFKTSIDQTPTGACFGKFISDIYNDPFCYYGTGGNMEMLPEQKEMLQEIYMDLDIQNEKSTYKLQLIHGIYEKDLKLLCFKKYVDPDVSIIIPVYNQFNYTYKCLMSILENSGDIPYEVIVADDCSTDKTKELEKYVSGINSTLAKKIVAYRDTNGKITSREDLKKVSGLGPKAFEQCAGFLKIPESSDPLDNTWVHPENYEAAREVLPVIQKKEKVTADLKKQLEEKYKLGDTTLSDIVDELQKPNRDPRDGYPAPIMQKGVVQFEDLKEGMKVTGKIKNVVDFGAFVDIGIHETGLIHVSELSDSFVKDPMDVIKVGDVKEFTIIGLDQDRRRISLSLKSDAASRNRVGMGGAKAAGTEGSDGKPGAKRVVVMKKGAPGDHHGAPHGDHGDFHKDHAYSGRRDEGSDDGTMYNPFAALLKK